MDEREQEIIDLLREHPELFEEALTRVCAELLRLDLQQATSETDG